MDIEDNVDYSFGRKRICIKTKQHLSILETFKDASKRDSGFMDGSNVVRTGGSVLGVMEDLIRVGKAMGFMMDGCEKDLEKIIGSQGDGFGFK
nr:RNA-directed DNA polymerase, eukaryota [Tanacetum cinerariifolium]